MSFCKWVAVKYRIGARLDVEMGPVFGMWIEYVDGTQRFYYDGGVTWFSPNTENLVVLKDYGDCHEEEGSDLDEYSPLKTQFCRDFPLLPAPYNPNSGYELHKPFMESIEGWLAPNGDYYQHEHGEHWSVGGHLCWQLYGRSGQDNLLKWKLGWATVHDGGVVNFEHTKHQLTEAQKKTLQSIADQVIDPLTRMSLEHYINGGK